MRHATFMKPLVLTLVASLAGCDAGAAKVDDASAKITVRGATLGEKLASEEGLKKIDVLPDMDPEALGAARAMDGYVVLTPAPLEVCGVSWKPSRGSVFVERATGLVVQSIHVADASCDDVMAACVSQLGQPARSEAHEQSKWHRFEGTRSRLRVVSLDGLESCTVLVQQREGIERVEKLLAE